jgi:riboflavin synthase
MFTGIIEALGEIKKITSLASGLNLAIQASPALPGVRHGDSIAVDGVCLTVAGLSAGGFTVDVSPESLQRTTLAARRLGQRVNLEQALRLSDRLGGHLVSGHVDGVATITAIEPKGDFIQIDFTAPENVLKYIIAKGSVAIDGISLTVNGCTARDFSVMVIPFTFAHTTLGSRAVGDRVNVENDLIGKYVEKFMTGSAAKPQGITRELLDKFGYT